MFDWRGERLYAGNLLILYGLVKHLGYNAGCIFFDRLCRYAQGCRDQGMTNWTATPVVQLKELEVNGTLMTDLTKSPAGGLCVEFDYFMDSINDTLSVSIVYIHGTEEPVWATAYNGTSLKGWQTNNN
nr:hypothetical protein BaRGS_002462 [Batillaria attramentaria]